MLELLMNLNFNNNNTFDPPEIYDNTVFKGFVPSEELIDGDTLAATINLTNGVSINNKAGWLKYILGNGQVTYIARKPLRYNVAWQAAYDAMANKTITLNGIDYVVRYMSGRANGSSKTSSVGTPGGEWDQLIYPIYNGVRRPYFPANTPLWANYLESDLGVGDFQQTVPNGGATLTKESVTISGTAGHAIRGITPSPLLGDLMGSFYQAVNGVGPQHGWRPVLIEKSTMPIYPFKGEVTQANLISFSDLASAVGYSGGVAMNTNDVWLHYIDGAKEFYVTKKPIRHTILWTALNSLGLVYGTKTIVIGGKTYKVRMLSGTTTDPGTTAGGEWDQYIYPIYNGMYAGEAAFQSPRWADYTDADLGLVTTIGGSANGSISLIQSKRASTKYNGRGYSSTIAPIMGVWYQSGDTASTVHGWRPVLELVP